MTPGDEISRGHEYSILLPCTTETFADFVSSLLGSAQTIERHFLGTFELTRSDIENTYHLVQQRVLQQNEASLIEFTVKILYDDSSSVLLNSLADFQHYREVRPIASSGVHLTWVYLIRFREKASPEKQQIDLTFHAGHRYDSDEIAFRSVSVFRNGHITLRIAHTARTWGVDLESLLAGHIESILLQDSTAKRFIYRHSAKIGLIASLTTFLIASGGAYLATRQFVQRQLAHAQHATAFDIPAKVNFLIERYAQGSWTQFTFLQSAIMVAAFIGAIAIGIWVASAAENRPESFVLLSKKAEENRQLSLRKRQRRWWLFAASLCSSVFAGVLANALFAIALHFIK